MAVYYQQIYGVVVWEAIHNDHARESDGMSAVRFETEE